MKLKINSIFTAIEGEGTEIGIKKVFIRLQGCSIRCKTCDTPESINPSKGKEMSLSSIYDNVMKIWSHSVGAITISGGEPLDQHEGLASLIDLLYPIKISLETSGQLYDDKIFIKPFVFLSLDLKTPSSGVEAETGVLEEVCRDESFKNRFQIKAVIKDWKDYDFVKKTQKKSNLNNLILTPCWTTRQDKPNLKFIDELCKKLDFPARIILQQHKIIYGPLKRGV